MLFKSRTLYSSWLFLYERFPKPERFGIGERIDNLFLDFLEFIHQSRYASVSSKLPFLEKTILKIDRIKFFLEIAWENKLIKVGQYAEILEKLEGIGRELGGWKKGILNKNSPRCDVGREN